MGGCWLAGVSGDWLFNKKDPGKQQKSQQLSEQLKTNPLLLV